MCQKLSYFIALILLNVNSLQAQDTKIIAHRGFWKTENNAQNSIESLKKAGKENFFGSEFDVYITKDDVLVVNHDATINGKNIETNNYHFIANEKLKNGETLPLLESYLKAGKKFPKLKLILEIKDHKENSRENKAVEKILSLVKKLKIENQVEYISFSKNICDQLKLQNPKVTVSYLEGDLSPKEVFDKNWNGIDYHFSVYQKNPTWISEAKSLGLITNVWTVNKAEVMQEMINLGLDYISTDEPLILRDLLK